MKGEAAGKEWNCIICRDSKHTSGFNIWNCSADADAAFKIQTNTSEVSRYVTVCSYFAHISTCSQRVKKVIKKIKTSHKQNPTASSLISAAALYFPWVFQSHRNKGVSLDNSTRQCILLVSNVECVSKQPVSGTIRDTDGDRSLALSQGRRRIFIFCPLLVWSTNCPCCSTW